MDINDMPYIMGPSEPYKDEIDDVELEKGERKRKPYVGRVRKILEPKREKGEVTSILKKMIRDMQGTDIKPLQTVGSKVIGNLFDRVKFLKERIAETESAIKARKLLNDRFNNEIDKDIEEMEKILVSLSDKEEIRDFKLNVSLLRMEKRKEETSFWRDMNELKAQLQELNEQYETESKISDLFADVS